MSLADAELAITTALQTAALGTIGTDLFQGPSRPPKPGVIPTQCIFVVEHGGLKPVPYMGSTQQSWDQPMVEVRIRSKKEDYLTGKALALSVVEALHLLEPPPAGFTWVKCKISRPRYIGRDQIDNHEWIVDVMLALKESF